MAKFLKKKMCDNFGLLAMATMLSGPSTTENFSKKIKTFNDDIYWVI